jgi:glycosyltransferase involved in cell wall biosynthesis
MSLAIDYVSPLPPVRSGIADYSLDLLPHLDRLCDLRLIHLPGQPLDDAIRQRYTVVSADRLGEGGRLPFYQMGNNHHHGDVWRLASQYPGVLTLHDLVLHHFLIERTAKHGDFTAYRQQLAADHGWIGEAASKPMRWPGGSGTAAQFALPAHRTLLLAQRGVITHSRWAAAELCQEMPQLRVRAVAMGIPLPPPCDAAAGLDFRHRRGLPLDVPLLGSFGFQTPIKRTDAVIRALASPALRGVHLMVAGEAAPTLKLEAVAASAGVAERVHFLGFLPFEDFEAAIGACDLCLNLRYPSAGETSASLLRILAVGKPAVVSEYAQSADLPDVGVVRIPVGDGEQDALVERLRQLLTDTDALARMGRQARQHIAEHHRPADAAAAMVDACTAWRLLKPPSSSQLEVPAPTTLTWRRLSGEVEVHGGETPWAAGERRSLEILLHNRSEARWLAAERRSGGVAVEVTLEGDDRVESHWLPLPRDLAPGASHPFSLQLRRPLGPSRLRILPHVLGQEGFAARRGPVWEAEI